MTHVLMDVGDSNICEFKLIVGDSNLGGCR